jgi:tetratricopeptide (TPR) repeat protein
MDVAEIEKLHQKLIADKKKYAVEYVGDGQQEAEAWVLHAEGKDSEALAILRKLADKQDREGEESTGIPAREMLADMLLDAKRPTDALAEYQTDLKMNPERFNGLYGAAAAAEQAGKPAMATEYYGDLVKVCAGGSSDRPELSRAKSLVAKK